MKASLHKETEEKMHVYEVGFVIMPSVSEDSLSEKASAIRGIIEKARGVVISEDFPKLMPLAYPMDKVTDSGKKVFNEAYFGWIKFEMPTASMSAVDKEISSQPEIIRSLIVKTYRENVLFPNKDGEEEGQATNVLDETSKDDKEDKEAIDQRIDALGIG